MPYVAISCTCICFILFILNTTKKWPIIDYITNYLKYYIFNQNPNIPNKDGWIPLRSACSNNNIEAIKLLLSHPNTDPNILDKNGSTPLASACFNNSIETIKLLLSHQKTDPNIPDKIGWPPLRYACYKNNIEAINLLLSHPKIENNVNYEKTDLHEACLKNEPNIDTIKNLLKIFHPNIRDKNGNTALHLVCSQNNANTINTLRLLLDDKQTDINIKSSTENTPLIISVLYHGNLHVINLLIKHGADISITDKQNYSFLYHAYNRQRIKNITDLDLIKTATEKKQFLNNELHTLCNIKRSDLGYLGHLGPTWIACAFASWCIDQGANINSRNEQGIAPIDVIKEQSLRNPCNALRQHYTILHRTLLIEKTESYVYYIYIQNNLKLCQILSKKYSVITLRLLSLYECLILIKKKTKNI